MPLLKGSSRYTVGKNIKELSQSGRPRQQSIAIALKEAGIGKSKKSKSARYRDGARLTTLKMPRVVMDSN